MVKLLIIVTRSEEHKWTDRGLGIPLRLRLGCWVSVGSDQPSLSNRGCPIVTDCQDEIWAVVLRVDFGSTGRW